MKKHGLFWTLWIALCLLLAHSPAAFAAGRITGQVADAGTGEALPGVNVVIQGTQRGAMTDAEGYFLILSVEPGAYRLTASMVGYGTVSKTDVRIRSGFTTTVDFQLVETTLEAEELVVTAERPPVEPDKTTSHYVLSAEQIEALPMARSVTELVSLQPGVNVTNALVVRGGDAQDVAYYVDGVRLQNHDVYGRQFSGINTTAVQEMTVISGGANAEFGNLESGAVSVVTKEGGRHYQGWTDFRYTAPSKKHWGETIYDSPFHLGRMKWDNKEWTSETVALGPGPDGFYGTADDEIGLSHRRLNYTDTKGSYIEGGLSGPIGSQANFFGSTRWTRQPYRFIGTFPSMQTPFDMRQNLKVTVRPGPNLKFSVGGIYSRVDGYNGGTNVQRDLASSGQNVFLPDGSGAGRSRITDNVAYATLTHTLGAKTFYEVRLGRYATTEDTLDVPHARDKFGFPIPTLAQKDQDGWFNVRPATAVDFTIADRTRTSLKADLSTQVSRGHFVKTGINFTYYDLYYMRYRAPTATSRSVEFITRPGNFPDVRAPLNPMQFEFYIQDKMEFEGMVVNVGVRFDAFYTNTRFFNQTFLQAPAFRWLIFRENIPTVDPQWATVISPRLGVSHPISARSAFHFTAGLYTRMPDYWSFFREVWNAPRVDTNIAWDGFNGPLAQNQMANYDVEFQKTRAYEAGADWNFVADYIVGISAYYKSAIDRISNGSRYWRDPRAATYVWGLKPKGYQDLKGLEVNLRKGFSHMFSFNAAINIGWATSGDVGSNATNFWPDSLFVSNQQYFIRDYKWDAAQNQYVPDYYSEADLRTLGNRANNTIRSHLNSIENTQTTVIWEKMDPSAYHAENFLVTWQPSYGTARLIAPKGVDNRVQGSLSVYFQSPGDFGPGLRKFHLLGDVRANLIWRIQSGSPYYYTPPGAQQEVRHLPIREWADLQMEKTLVKGGLRNVIAYIEVLNLFNQQDSLVPFNRPDYNRWGLNQPRPNDANFLAYGDYNELTRYVGTPRQTAMGIKVNF